MSEDWRYFIIVDDVIDSEEGYKNIHYSFRDPNRTFEYMSIDEEDWFVYVPKSFLDC